MTDAYSDLLGSTPQPDLLAADEFAPAAPRPRGSNPGRTILVLPPNPTADTHGEKFMKLHTQNKIRQVFHNLAMNNLDAVQTWLHKLAEESPAAALDRFIELAKFSLPQLKETSVNVTQNGTTRSYSMQELEAELQKPD